MCARVRARVCLHVCVVLPSNTRLIHANWHPSATTLSCNAMHVQSVRVCDHHVPATRGRVSYNTMESRPHQARVLIRG